jgi:hypothetical protein
MAKTMKNKKGIQLNQAVGAILVLTSIAVLLIVSLIIFTNLGVSNPQISVSINNETSFINNSGDFVNNATDCNFANVAIVRALNRTDQSSIASGNYTITSSGIIRNASAANYNNASITYSYTYGGQVCSSSGDMVTNFTKYPTLVGLIGTILLLGIVIGVLVLSFTIGNKNKP